MSKGKLKVGVLSSSDSHYMAARVFDANLSRCLAAVAEVVPIAADRGERSLALLPDSGLDVVYVDLFHLGIDPVLQREQESASLRFWFVYHSLNGYLARFLAIRPLLRADDVVTAPSEYAVRALRRIYGRHPVREVPNFIDVRAIGAQQLTEPADRDQRFVFLGQLTLEKGLDVFLQLIERVREDRPSLVADVIGPLSGSAEHDVPSAFVTELQSRFSHLVGPGRPVAFHGFLDGTAKYAALSRGRFLVNPSTAIGESFGMTNLEAMACAVPVLCSDWSAFPDVVRHGETGLLVPVSWDAAAPRVDLGALCTLAARLLDDEGLCRRLAGQARKAAQRHDAAVGLPPLLELLERPPAAQVERRRWSDVAKRTYAEVYDDVDPELAAHLELSSTTFETLARASVPGTPEARAFMDLLTPAACRVLCGFRDEVQ